MPTDNKKELEELVKKITNINQMVQGEYDFIYGDGSGDNTYDMTKLNKIKQDAIKGFVQQLQTYIAKQVEEATDAYKWFIDELVAREINTYEWMVTHPNDSLLDFMAGHVPSKYHDQKKKKLEKQSKLNSEGE